MKNKVSHEGHRQRLKNRFLSSSLNSFEPHNILELLLFYSIPRQDTNEIAHALLDRFGTIKGVFDADFTELIKIPGIKENSATLIKMIPQLSRIYMMDAVSEDKILDTADKVGNYLTSKFIGETNEVVYLLILDNRFQLLDSVRLVEGSVNSSLISPRKILDEVTKRGASTAIIAHNHPNGLAIPSMEDIDTTAALSSALEMFDIFLIEHFVVAGDKYVPIMHTTSMHTFNAPKLRF